MKLILIILAAASLSACQNGQYVGPSIGISGGFNGATIGVTLYGKNPITEQAATTTSVGVVQVSTGVK